MRHLKAGTVALAILASVPAMAENIVMAVSKQRTGDMSAVLSGVQEVVLSLEPGDSFALLDAADGAMITQFTLPDKGRYRLAQYVEQDFGEEIADILSFLAVAARSEPVGIEGVKTDIPAVFAAIGDMQAGFEEPPKVLIAGAGLRIDRENPAFSMLGENGSIYRPSDSLLAGPLSLSPFGMATGQGSLEGATLHFCPILPVEISAYQKRELGRVWTQFAALRGGELATFNDDFRLCLERFVEGQTGSIEVTPLDIGAELAMLELAAGNPVRLSDGRIGVRSALVSDLEQALAAAESKVQQAESQNLSLSSRLAGTESALADAEEKIEDYKAIIEAAGKWDSITRFVLFHEVTHDRYGKMGVTTGIGYSPSNFPTYDDAWCYLSTRNEHGSNVRLDVANKVRGRDIDWRMPSDTILADAGLTREGFADYRRSCRFPED